MRPRSWALVWMIAAAGFAVAAYGQLGELTAYDDGSLVVVRAGHAGHVAMCIAMLVFCFGALVGAIKARLVFQDRDPRRWPPQSGG